MDRFIEPPFNYNNDGEIYEVYEIIYARIMILETWGDEKSILGYLHYETKYLSVFPSLQQSSST